jgi:aspartate ammonia-lyase
MTSVRIEKDSIGEMKIPETADYGIHTARAVENFPITGVLLNHYPKLVQSLAMAKKAAASLRGTAVGRGG